MTLKPFAPACERNREPILAVLRQHFAGCRRVLEIGSGSGQHAVHFAAALPWLAWQCSDVADNLPGIRLWLDEAGLANTPAPIELDVAQGPWPIEAERAARSRSAPHPPSAPLDKLGAGSSPRTRGEGNGGFDAVFSANTLHIMGWPAVEALFAGVGRLLQARDATLAVYGPFNYGGDYSSDSNRVFDGWLKARDPHSGIRDFEAVDALARGIGLQLVDDVAMPANNRCLVWRQGHATLAPAPKR